MIQFPITPAQGLQSFYLLITVAAFTVYAVPFFRLRFLHYGSRQPASKSSSTVKKHGQQQSILESVMGIQVPHSWFIHFYIASVASSIFWAYQVLTKGSIYSYLTSQMFTMEGTSMTINQVVITWALWTLQGSRRLFECIILNKPSDAKMPVPTWAIGIIFYLAMGISVWIEGIRKYIFCRRRIVLISIAALESTTLSIQSFEFSKPSIKTYLALPLFVLASGVQHDCHAHLSNLQKYSLPDHQFFQWLLCPHYTSESIIYLSLAIVSAPSGQHFNKTIAMAGVFTTSNLALTAESSRQWYANKFGAEKIKGRWRILPFIF
jgi:3-oxo-5-alpha-steroid 4-dehydrogenase 3